jgi:Leucine-rich repeat (LRR) protein
MTHDQAYLAAEKKIQQALHSGATELDLSNMKLTELPDSLGQLTQLQTLSVNLNLLTSLPESLGNLSNLKSLNIGSNKFTSLPVKIEKLTQLSVLKFYGNRLSEIPSWISHLKLKELIIGDSNGGIPFDELPSTIRELTVLETLWLGKCELRTLPEWIGELPALKSLWCFNNNLTDLPPSLAQLEHLKELKLSGNPLNPALQSAYDACSEGKYEPLFAYLHSQTRTGRRRQRRQDHPAQSVERQGRRSPAGT